MLPIQVKYITNFVTEGKHKKLRLEENKRKK